MSAAGLRGNRSRKPQELEGRFSKIEQAAELSLRNALPRSKTGEFCQTVKRKSDRIGNHDTGEMNAP